MVEVYEVAPTDVPAVFDWRALWQTRGKVGQHRIPSVRQCHAAGAPTHFALEGAVAVAGLGISWMCNNLGLATVPEELEVLAASVRSAVVWWMPCLAFTLPTHSQAPEVCQISQLASSTLCPSPSVMDGVCSQRGEAWQDM